MPSFPPVAALTRGLEVLRVVSQQGHASVAEIHRQTGLHRPTVVRMLETLQHAGYVVRHSGTARYAPSGKVLLLSNGYRAHARLAAVAEPIMNELRARVGWPSDLAIPDHDAMMLAVTTRAFDHILLNRPSGTRAPFLASALGRAYLAHCSPPECEGILERLRVSQSTFDLAAQDSSSVEYILHTTRERGYAIPDPRYSETVYQGVTSGFAVPIRVGPRVVGSINLVILSSIISLPNAVRALLPELEKSAHLIGARLSGDAASSAPP